MEKDIIIKADNISKQYRLGTVGTGTLSHDLNRWWHKIRGKEDPYLMVGDTNDRSTKGTSDYVWALRDINFEVERGEVLGIIGKNGAGKSTLLKILAKVTAPTTGSIKFKGRIASLLEVGTGFNGELTGRENIYLNGAILGMTKKEITSKLDEIIDFSGCERYIDTPVKRYSSGMTVRLAFAVAAFLEPEILIIDEVLAVGDADFQKKAIGKMQDISRGEGRTVLFVSHNMAAIKNLCTRCVLLEYGSVSMSGNTQDVMNYYLSKERKNITSEILKSDHINVLFNLFNNKGLNTDTIKCGESFIIEIDLMPHLELKKFDITIAVFNLNDQRIMSYSTRFQLKEKSNLKNKTKCKMICKDNILAPGTYELQIGIYTEGNYLVSWENVYELHIIEGDYYLTGRLPDSGAGHILPKSEWEFI